MSRLLIPFSWVYGLVVLVRNLFFDIGLFRIRPAGVPVLSVGNLTVGGTGKTPLVEYLAGELLRRGIRAAVISRGYGRKTRGVVVVADGSRLLATADEGGDEAVQVARKYPGLPVVVGERRVDAARTAVEKLGAKALILDDGFQHRFLHRDLDIVLLDARVDPFRERLLPAGRRREPFRGLSRAGVVALSKLPEGMPAIPWSAGLKERTDAAVVSFRIVPGPLRWAATGMAADEEAVRGARVVAVSGIADNSRFAGDLRAAGVSVSSVLGFSDHHRYTPGDISRILNAVRETLSTAVATTTKDLARLSDGPGKRLLDEVPVLVLPVEIRWVEGEQILLNAVDAAVSTKGRL